MIIYRDAVLNDMGEIAEVHIRTQPEYFTSTLGKDLLTKFYTEFFLEDGLFVVAVDDTQDQIVGFCMGHYYGSHAEKNWERNNQKQIINRLLLKCIQLNKLTISRSYRRLKGLFVKNIEPNKERYFAHLLSLGVLEAYRGNHIASTLIDRFEEKCLTSKPDKLVGRGTACTIGAYKWNTAGCKLYEYKGYRVYEESETKLKFTKDL